MIVFSHIWMVRRLGESGVELICIYTEITFTVLPISLRFYLFINNLSIEEYDA